MTNTKQINVQQHAATASDANANESRGRLWRVALYFAAMVLLFFREPLLYPLHFHIPYDLDSYHYPLSDFIAWSLREFHRLPWWNPYSYMGQPFYSNTQAAMFYPPTLLTIFIGNAFFGRFPYYLLELQLAAHLVVAGTGAYALIRSMRAGHWPSLAGGTIYSLGGFFASQTQHLGVISAAAWLPWFLAALHRLERRRDLRSGAIAGVVLALMILPGFPAGYLPVFVFGPFLYIYWVRQNHSRRERGQQLQAIALLILAFFLGILLSAASWLPAYGVSRQSAAALRPTSQATGGIPVEAATSFFWPNLFGQLGTNPLLPGNPSFLHLYQGMPALLLVLGGSVWLLRSRQARPFVVTCILAFLWMFGTALVVSEIIYLIYPYFVRRGIYAHYVFAYFSLSFAILAALILDAYEKKERTELISSRPVWWAASLCVFLALLLAAIGSLTSFATNAVNSSTMLLWIALVLATCGLLARGQEWKLADNFTSAAFCFLIAVDLIVVGSNNRLNNSPGQRDGMPSAVHFLIEKLGPHPLYRIDSTGVWEQWQTEIPEWRIPSANGMDPLLLLSTELYRAPFSSVNGRQFTLTSFQSPLLNLAGIRYIVTSAKRLGDMPRVYHGEVNIFENSGALPRFFLVGGVVASPDAASAVHMIDSGQIDAVRVAVVPSQELAHFAGLSIPGSTAELGKVELLSYAPDQLRLRLETSRPAVLVSTETFWKDWRATVDAKPQTITLVDGIFRGVVVPMGNHEVTMFIRPTVLYVGIAASIAGVLISLLLIVGPNLTKALSRPV